MILFAAVIVSLLNMLSHCCCVGGEKHNHKGPQTRGRINGGKGRDSAIYDEKWEATLVRNSAHSL